MRGLALWVMVVVGGLVLFVARAVAGEIVKQEYGNWAPALARALVRLAGRIHPSRADEWLADVLYLQAAGSETSLCEACAHLRGAPQLQGRAALAALGDGLVYLSEREARTCTRVDINPVGVWSGAVGAWFFLQEIKQPMTFWAWVVVTISLLLMLPFTFLVLRSTLELTGRSVAAVRRRDR